MKPLFFALLLLLSGGHGWAAQPDQGSGGHQPLLAPDGSPAPAPLSTNLPKGQDLIDWALLGTVEILYPNNEKPPKSKSALRILTPEGWEKPKSRFPDAIKALNGQELKIAGFMFPLDLAQEGQKRFLLAKTPPTCAFCLPGGPESMVLVEASEPIPFTQNALIVQGHFATLEQNKEGIYYKMTNAHPEKPEN